MKEKDRKVDWLILIIIPIIFWGLCMGLSVGKMFQTGNEIHILDWLDVFNSNISTVVYGVVAVINACRYCLVTAIIMAVVSIVYVILLFRFMRLKR